jgi:hypothetical protein
MFRILKVSGDLDSTRILDFMLSEHSLSCSHLHASGFYADPLKMNSVFLHLISSESFLPFYSSIYALIFQGFYIIDVVPLRKF